MKKWCVLVSFLSSFTVYAQTIVTVAGNGHLGSSGDGGPATAALVDEPTSGKFDRYGNYYFADALSNKIRKITPAGIISTVAGNGLSGYVADDVPATNATLSTPDEVALDTSGNIYIADANNGRIRKVDAATGIITTVAGNGSTGYGSDGVAATSTSLWGIQSICLDKFGNLYIADGFNYRIRKVNPTGIISTFAGNGIAGYSGEGTFKDTSMVGFVAGLCSDTAGNIYFTNNSISVRAMKISTSGIMTTVAGNGVYTYTGDGIPATDANIGPVGIFVDNENNIFLADKVNNRAYKVDAGTGILYCIAGNGLRADYGDGGPATAASLFNPRGIVLDMCNNVYITTEGSIAVADSGSRVREIVNSTSPMPVISISVSPNDTVCAGTTVTYTSAIDGVSSPAYQWYKNGVAMSTAASYSEVAVNGDSIVCVLHATAICSGNPVTRISNFIKMVVNPFAAVSVAVSASPGASVCAGTAVTYTAATTGGGATPAYQWYKNGTAISTAGSYSYTPANGDSVRCVLTSSAACPVPAIAASTVYMTVQPYAAPAITIAVMPAEAAICSGTAIAIVAATANEGPAPIFQWKRNGIVVGGSTPALGFVPANGDSVTCTLTSDYACITGPAMITSNVLHLAVDTITTPTIAITSVTSAHVGSIVTVNALVTGASAYNIKWYNHNALFATTTLPTATYTKDTLVDTITAIVIPTGTPCYDSATAEQLYVQPLGVSDVAAAGNGISVYPNPAGNGLTIEATIPIQSVSLTNAIGQLLKSRVCDTKTIMIDVADLPPGVYIIRVNGTYMQKLVKE